MTSVRDQIQIHDLCCAIHPAGKDDLNLRALGIIFERLLNWSAALGKKKLRNRSISMYHQTPSKYQVYTVLGSRRKEGKTPRKEEEKKRSKGKKEVGMEEKGRKRGKRPPAASIGN